MPANEMFTQLTMSRLPARFLQTRVLPAELGEPHAAPLRSAPVAASGTGAELANPNPAEDSWGVSHWDNLMFLSDVCF